MRNIYSLSTDKLSRLHITLTAPIDYDPHNKFLNVDRPKWILYDKPKGSGKRIFAIHLYITSNEIIKEGDWYTNGKSIFLCTDLLSVDKKRYYYLEKIILTTDIDLIEDGVQAVEDEFLQWFVKNPTCKSVMVIPDVKGLRDIFQPSGKDLYKIIIPKPKSLTKEEQTFGESMVNTISIINTAQLMFQTEESKQETLEEAAENNNSIKIAREAFIEGAKWQQERSYSEEDLREAFKQGHKSSRQLGSYNELTEQEDYNKWFKQFKGKHEK